MPQKGKASKRLKIAKGADSKHTHADTEAVTDTETVTDIDTHTSTTAATETRLATWLG